MNLPVFVMLLSVFAYLCILLGQISTGKPKPTIRQAASIIGKIGRQTQLRTQAEKTREIHDELRESIGSSRDHAITAGDAAPRGRPA